MKKLLDIFLHVESPPGQTANRGTPCISIDRRIDFSNVLCVQRALAGTSSKVFLQWWSRCENATVIFVLFLSCMSYLAPRASLFPVPISLSRDEHFFPRSDHVHRRLNRSSTLSFETFVSHSILSRDVTRSDNLPILEIREIDRIDRMDRWKIF